MTFYNHTNALPQSERLIFRELTMDDVDTWMEFINSPEAVKFLGIPMERQSAIIWMERAKRRYEDFGMGMWALIDKQSGEMVGNCGLLVQDVDGQQELEIGYHLIPRFWKKGYATEAAKACKEFAFTHNLSDYVISIIHVENFNSQHVAERNGMKVWKQTTFRDWPVFIYRVDRA